MACILNGGYQLSGCKGLNSGGIARIYIAAYSGTTTFATDVDEVITGITANPTFYTFDLTKETSMMEDKPEVSLENDVITFKPTVKLIINRLNATVRNQIKVLVQSRVHIIVEDNNGNFWLFGKTKGLDLTEGTAGSGTKILDRSGYELTFSGTEPNPIYSVSSTAFTPSY